ncbi:LacI family DNA-binding transcriptional regulator [Arthrobacter koreensis]|uniref:LacI family DNA-binding transcriptional regulator n=1 Tax=Arthrobacter koreensis TaxID=199136 RepID=UPI0036DB13BB
MPRKRVTLADVAERAGLSRTAASMILNGRPDTRLSKEAHERVHAAAAELGYRPNVAARGLRTDKTRTIGFISDTVATTRFASGLIKGALAASENADHVMLVLETGGDPRREQRAINAVLDRQVDGIIFAAMRARELYLPELPSGTSVVMLNATNPHHSRAVLPHELLGGRRAVDHLVSRGITDGIVLIGQSDSEEQRLFRSATVEQRVIGIRTAMAEHKLTFAAEVSSWDWEPKHGYVMTKGVIKNHRNLKALICMNDRLAFGAYQALSEAGLDVPGDVSVIGFDNDEVAAYLRPGLTTVALPHEAMGCAAVDLLLADTAAEPMFIPMPLIERESVQLLPSG